MAKYTLTRYTCDRCKAVEDVKCAESSPVPGSSSSFMKFYTEGQTPNNWMLLSVANGQKQFCSNCANSYRDWLASGASLPETAPQKSNG
jgi:hypothetical protein